MSKEQSRTFKNVRDSKQNFFITGPAGTGKSFLFKLIAQDMKSRHGLVVASTATSGLAANAINGSTIHSFAGYRSSFRTSLKIDLDKWILFIKRNPMINYRLTKVDLILIEEASMLCPILFSGLDQVLKILRLEFYLILGNPAYLLEECESACLVTCCSYLLLYQMGWHGSSPSCSFLVRHGELQLFVSIN
jgi:ABC-type transport system involved in cytochrome c biogenesis ATPase subunit